VTVSAALTLYNDNLRFLDPPLYHSHTTL